MPHLGHATTAVALAVLVAAVGVKRYEAERRTGRIPREVPSLGTGTGTQSSSPGLQVAARPLATFPMSRTVEKSEPQRKIEQPAPDAQRLEPQGGGERHAADGPQDVAENRRKETATEQTQLQLGGAGGPEIANAGQHGLLITTLADRSVNADQTPLRLGDSALRQQLVDAEKALAHTRKELGQARDQVAALKHEPVVRSVTHAPSVTRYSAPVIFQILGAADVFAQPDADADIVARLPAKSQVSAVGVNGDFIEIRSRGDRTGYVRLVGRN